MDFSSTDYNDACEDQNSCSILNDGHCDSSPGCCSSGGAQWAGGGADPWNQAPRGTYVTYIFDTPVSIQCVQLCQSDSSDQQVLSVILQYSDGASFLDFDLLSFPDKEGSAVTKAAGMNQLLPSCPGYRVHLGPCYWPTPRRGDQLCVSRSACARALGRCADRTFA